MTGFLLDHLWQSTLFAAVAGLLTLTFTANSAAVRHGLWFAASVKFLIPFSTMSALGSFLFQSFAPQSPPQIVSNLQSAAEPFSGAAPVLSTRVLATPVLTAHIVQSINWATLLLCFWALGFSVISAIWLVRRLKLRAALAGALPLSIDAPMPVKSSAASLEPGLIGIWRPVLVLPRGIETHLSPPEMRAILAHEICHLRRRDNLLAAIHMIVEALFWFHPLVWWLGARLVAERENACDEAVLSSGSDPQTYAESILKVCQFYMHSPLDCASGVSGADLKRRIEIIMESKLAIRLNVLQKSFLTASAAAAIAAPLALGMLTATPTFAPALAQTAGAPHPGTEAALRHQIESMEKGQADFDVMVPSLAQAARSQSVGAQANIQKWGALKSITFRENQNDNDVYSVEFENQLTVWTIGPLQPDGKVGPVLGFGPAIKRDGNSPSPGLEAAIRQELDGDFTGNPALEIMSPPLQNATQNQWKMISANGKMLGAVQTITFQNINARGWDVYHVTFANGTATLQAAPLTDGKLTGILHTDILLPHQPQHPGTEAWMRRHIAAVLKGTPNYEDMGPFLKNAVQRQWPGQISFYKSLGALQSLAFEGGAGSALDGSGVDVYLATFQNGKVRWHIESPDATGKVDGTLFFQKVN
jgi:beta-lactamase regulating signal transducer with metallopeptidase domain